MLPQELVELLEEYEDDCDVIIRKLDSNENATIEFEVLINGPYLEEHFQQRWVMEAIRCRDARLATTTRSHIEVCNDHALLWDYTDRQTSLYFAGDCRDIGGLFRDLFLAHEELFEGHKGMEHYINGTKNFMIGEYSNGLLAEGPERLMEAYLSCLEKHGLHGSTLGDHAPTRWDGEKFVPEDRDLSIAFMGDSYFIAKEFHFKRME